MFLIDSIYCRTEDFAKEMFQFYLGKGFSVLQSTAEIETGTHGKHVVKKLDTLSKEKTQSNRNFKVI